MGKLETAEVATYNLEEEAANGSREQLVMKPIKSWKGYLWDTWE